MSNSKDTSSKMSSSTALTDVEEVRARHQTIRDRLAARRQQREHLLASTSVAKSGITGKLPGEQTGGGVQTAMLKTPVSLLASRMPTAHSKGISLMTMNSLLTPAGIIRITAKPSDVKPTLRVEVVKDSGDQLPEKPTVPANREVIDNTESEQNASKVSTEVPNAEYTKSLTVSVSTLADTVTLEPSDRAEQLPTLCSQSGGARKHLAEEASFSEKAKRPRSSRKKQTDQSERPVLATTAPEASASLSHPLPVDSVIPMSLTAGVHYTDRGLDKETVFRTELEDLLGTETAREKENTRTCKEILDLLNTPTAKERYLSEKFRTQGGSQVQQFCSHGTRGDCSMARARLGDTERWCGKLHFRKIIHPHTDESLGDCSFLNTCFHVDTCKYVHYTIDHLDQNTVGGNYSATTMTAARGQQSVVARAFASQNRIAMTVSGSVIHSQPSSHETSSLTLYPPQWINCDIRMINMSVLGKFAVIMADPPWDIHMELPYGTMSDEEMRRMDIPCLQDDGYLFLWVTGRAMELGRECLRLWGYQRVDEIIWVKTNQLQRLIRTGRTGHWLNHGKEHCLVGVKGHPQGVNVGLDCDVIVSEVRETSHKPDEIYGIIERLSPGTRKLELFGRPHNLQPNWITLGNQLEGTYLVDPSVVERFKKQYPNGLDTKGR